MWTFYERTAENLRREGYLVLLVDYVGRRGLQNRVGARSWETAALARSFGLTGRSLELRDVSQLDAVVSAAVQEQAQALLLLSDAIFYTRRGQIALLAARHRLPCVAWTPEFADSGCLFTYGANVVELHRRAAAVVDRILKGAASGSLPVERPTKLELVVNKSQDGQGARPHDPSDDAGPGRPGHRVSSDRYRHDDVIELTTGRFAETLTSGVWRPLRALVLAVVSRLKWFGSASTSS